MVSDLAVFPGPLLLKDCGFDPFGPSAGGSHRTMVECWLHPGTLHPGMLLLLPEPQECCRVPAHPRKSSGDSVVAAFQGLWKITTYIWHQVSPSTTLPSTSECGCLLGSAVTRWLQQSLPNVLPAVELLFSVWPKNLPDLTLFLGIHLSHQSTAGYGAVELQPLCSPCLQS